MRSEIKLYKNLEIQNGKILKNIDWSRKRNKYFSKLHSISSYLAMFSPSLPKYFIEKYSKENDTVMDNFSGRGTTALVARELDRKFIGSDLNPYAIVLSKFKISNLKKEKLIKRIQLLSLEFNKKINFYISKTNENKYEELRIFYSNFNLSQLIFIRENIGKNWEKNNEIDNAVLAYALGLMHGKTKKNGTSSFFSLSMPNTISMSPNYVKKFSEKNNLIKPESNIFELIIERIKYKYDELLETKYKGKIFNHDSTKKNKNILNNSIDLVITSPPYLNVVNYTNSNWLKLWLLGYDRNELKEKIFLSDKLNYENYVSFIKKYLISIHSKLKIGSKICLVVGDINDKKLIENVWQEIRKYVKYNFVEIYYDSKYKQNNKVTNMLNKKRGYATLIEKVLVLEKYEN